MNDNNYDQYNVILTGHTKNGMTKARVIARVAELLQTSRDNIAPFFQGEAKVFKSQISHKKAFEYKTKLAEMGAEVNLERIHIAEVETGFSMVPDGEEQTPYSELQKRLSSGEQVACNKCGQIQELAPFCCECGKPLIGSTIPAAENIETPQSSLAWLVKLLFVLAVLAAAGYFYFQLV